MSTEIEVMKPLYPPEGAPCRGYVCLWVNGLFGTTCLAVTRTKRGMWSHLRNSHGVTRQLKLALDKQAEKVGS